jgi:methylated-DNA-[protein]-cysteine S-methyltransferase
MQLTPYSFSLAGLDIRAGIDAQARLSTLTVHQSETQSHHGSMEQGAGADARLVDGAAARTVRLEDEAPAGVREAAVSLQQQLAEYFARRRREFEIALNPQGTPFQLAVWTELGRIPYGSTLTYAELARRVDGALGATAAQAAGLDPAEAPGGSLRIRAVGRANALNPVWLLIPCHRILGSDGSLTGYAGGLALKRRLLELEGALAPRLFG